MAERLSELMDVESSLTDEERELLQMLGGIGAATPAELAVKTFSLPEEVNELLVSLRKKQLIEIRQVKGRLGGDLITLNQRGLRLAKGE